ncbi:DNA (cytosine-5-)-methyltransferase [Paenibacillus glucanolyticus]|uniref:DNA cytosine methyltransferase n=1 Tax=Paenibacillus glucanolyticus TaxID=59843 RepID=UPI0030CEC5CF
MRKLSLFSGIGGIDLAAHWAGIETVAFCERDLFPQKVLRKHWPNVPIYDDVCTLTAERLKEDGIIGPGRAIDVISAGYPCQPFSNAGNRKGKEDDRHLWPEVARLLREIRPRWFLGENVAGHITLGLDDVLIELESIGYTAQALVIPSSAVGAPHRRDRVFIVGYTSSKGFQEWRQSGFATFSKKTGTGMEPESERSGENVADPESERSREAWEHQCGRSAERIAGSCETLAHSYSESGLETSSPLSAFRSLREPRNNACRCSRKQSTGISGGAIESRLGGMLDGISSWLERHPWPAGQGSEQYDWEPPRVATGVKDRVGRLKALGNAVNPVQVLPILAAIKAIDDQL